MAKSTDFEVEERFRKLFVEQKKLKKELEEFNERYALITENVNDYIGVLDKDLKFEYINEEFHKKHLGYSKKNLIGSMSIELIHPDDIKRVLGYYKKAIKTGEGKIEFRVKDKNGNYFWVEVKGKRFVDVNNQLKTLIITRDITDRKEMERKIKESEEMYRLISENANDLIRVLNDRFEFEYVNENVHKRLLGYTIEDLRGKTHLPFLHPEDRRHAIRSTMKNLKKGEGSYQARFKDKRGNYKWFEFAGKIFYNSIGEKKILSIARDIDKRKIAELKLKESEEKYRKAYNRAQFYKDLFVHDMSNILAVINSSAELIPYYCGESEQSKNIKNITDIVRNQVDRGAKLVSNVNMLSELEEHLDTFELIEINVLLENSFSFIRNSFKDRNIKIQFDSSGKKLEVYANQLLREVFDNILINGIKYNENIKVEFIIRTSKVKLEQDKFVKIEFMDNGIGIPDDRKEMIFKRGNRELKGTKGMGIGLSLVKKIIKGYHGKIWIEDRVENDYTKGSNFIILIPQVNYKL
ncbi:MAG: PAS domain S-box protein [Promethearchaeota archaeon]